MMSQNEQIYLTATFVVKAAKIEEAKKLLQELVVGSNQEEGCLYYQLFQDNAQPQKFVIIEHWLSKTALDLHATSKHLLELRPLLQPLLEAPIHLQKLDKIAY